MGAMMKCSFGAAPASLIVLPVNRVVTNMMPAANIMDNKPFVNIPPFGMCSAPSSPVVIAATAAKLGVFTPVPCTPVTPAPWVPGAATVLEAFMPALDDTSTLMCVLGQGVITFVNAGETNEMIP
jgi:hypothetical protein